MEVLIFGVYIVYHHNFVNIRTTQVFYVGGGVWLFLVFGGGKSLDYNAFSLANIGKALNHKPQTIIEP